MFFTPDEVVPCGAVGARVFVEEVSSGSVIVVLNQSVNSDLNVDMCLIIPWKGSRLIKDDRRVPFSTEAFITFSLNDSIIIITRM